MAKDVQQYKVDRVEAVKTVIEEYQNFYFSDYRGLSVGEITELRNQLREKQACFVIVKNRFTKIALRELGHELVDDCLVGPTALALVRDDYTGVSKVLLDFGRNTTVKIKGGYIDGKVVDVQEAVALSRLPDRSQLLTMLVTVMQSPTRNLAYVLNAAIEQVARVLQAIVDQKATSTESSNQG